MQIPYINQILLLAVVITLTTVLTIAGIEVIHILKELRESVKTFNKVLDDSHTISSSIAKPVEGMSSFIMGIKSGADIIGGLLGKGKGGK